MKDYCWFLWEIRNWGVICFVLDIMSGLVSFWFSLKIVMKVVFFLMRLLILWIGIG